MSETNIGDGDLVAEIGLVEVIRTRLLGVKHEDQDVVLDDADWRAILDALEPVGPFGDGRYCRHHDDDPAHDASCYVAPKNKADQSKIAAIIHDMRIGRSSDDIATAITAYLSAIEPVEATAESAGLRDRLRKSGFRLDRFPTCPHFWHDGPGYSVCSSCGVPEADLAPVTTLYASPPSPQRREEIIEECAKVAEDFADLTALKETRVVEDAIQYAAAEDAAREIAAAIRSLASPSGAKPNG